MALGKFQMMDAKGWKGITTNNHLASIFQTKPQVATPKMVMLLGKHYGKSLEQKLSEFPIKYLETNDDFTWQLIGSSDRNIPLVEAIYQGAIVTSTSSNIGQGRTLFELVFEEDWFHDGNVIVGEKNEIYPIIVKGECRVEGPTRYVYTCEVTGRAYDGIPGEELVGGKLFSKEYTPVEKEGSLKVGGINHTSPISMRNNFTTLRMQHKAYGSMLNKKLAVGMPFLMAENNGKAKEVIIDTWMHWENLKFERTFLEEKCKAMMFGTSNRDGNGEYYNFGKSGHVIEIGDGIRPQCNVANAYYYPNGKTILTLIESALYELSRTKLDFGERKFLLRTGELGAKLFHQAVLNTTSGWLTTVVGSTSTSNPSIVSKVQNKLHDNSLSAGFQFVEFKAPNGVTVSIEVEPMYDDPIRNKLRWKTVDANNNPIEGPAESFRFDLYYIGSTEEPNIQLVKVKGQEDMRGYQWGPFANAFNGNTGNSSASFDEDAAVMHIKSTFAIMVLDPTRTMSFIPNVQAA